MSIIQWDIIKKSLIETLTPLEQHQLDEWLSFSDDNRQLYNDAKGYYRNELSRIHLTEKEISNSWNLFIKKKKARHLNRVRAISAVAAFAGIFIGLTIFLSRVEPNSKSDNLVAQTGVMLTIEGGETTNLKEDSKLIISKEGIKEVSKNGHTQLKARVLQNSTKYATASTSNDIYHMTLEDGTKVWLNRNSKIRFPLSFASNAREVTVEGEAYFEVTHNAVKPFIVTSKRSKVKVLGTKFNFVAGDDQSFSTTTLVDGSVEMTISSNNEKIIIKPGTRAEESNNGILVKEVDVTTVTAWTINKLILKDATVDDIAHALKVKYGVEVIVSEKIDKTIRYSLYTDLNNSLSEVVSAIRRLDNIEVEMIDNNIVVIKVKSE